MNNKAFGTDNCAAAHAGPRLAGGSDVSTDTSGHQDEYFDQQANSTDIRWTVNDTFSIKYIFGYTDYFYDRTSDVDLTSNTDAFTSYSGDQQFYVSQETEYISHELQFFNDWNDRLTTTTGLFYYKADITQRGDYYDSNSNGRYTQGFDYSPSTVGAPALHRRHSRRSTCSPRRRQGLHQRSWLIGGRESGVRAVRAVLEPRAARIRSRIASVVKDR